jgi:glycosyltransferase involved in cell wall biosynthesis
MMPLISIIVPIYNTERYLGTCIDSILSQTHNQIQLILVDDGSQDNSSIICDSYAEKDERVIIIHKDNAGVSSARNLGLKNAAGDYIGFVDSDDWIEPNMFEEMLKKIREENAQLCICNKYFRNGEIMQFGLSEDRRVMSSYDGIISLLRFQFTTSLCLSLYTKEIIKDIFLNETIHYWEDWEYQFRIVANLKKLTICQKPLYHYTLRAGSTTQLISDKVFSCLDIVGDVEKYINKNIPALNDCVKDLRAMFLFSVVELAKKSKPNNIIYNGLIKANARICLVNTYKSKFLSLKDKAYICILAISPNIFYIVNMFCKKLKHPSIEGSVTFEESKYSNI